MASIKISKINSVIANMRYLMNEKSHDGVHDRIGSVNAHNMSIFNAEWEAISNMKHWGKEHNVQGYSIIQSFDKDELDPENPDDLERANEAGMKLAMDRAGDDRQILVVTQADNGYVHNHILMMSTAMSDGYALDTKQLKRSYVIEASDRILAEMQIKNKNAEMDRQNKKTKESMAEIKRRSKGQYVWKDDLRDRIDEALINDGVKNNDEFSKVMSDKGVDVMYHEKTGNISYKFKDQEGKDRKCRASRLGDGYGKKNIDKIYETNIAKDKEIGIEKGSMEDLMRKAGLLKATEAATSTKFTQKSNAKTVSKPKIPERKMTHKPTKFEPIKINTKDKAREQERAEAEAKRKAEEARQAEAKRIADEKARKEAEEAEKIHEEKPEESISEKINKAPTIAERIKIAQEQAEKDKKKKLEERTKYLQKEASRIAGYNNTKDDMQLGG